MAQILICFRSCYQGVMHFRYENVACQKRWKLERRHALCLDMERFREKILWNAIFPPESCCQACKLQIKLEMMSVAKHV